MESSDSDDSPESVLPSDFYSSSALKGNLGPGGDKDDLDRSDVAPSAQIFREVY